MHPFVTWAYSLALLFLMSSSHAYSSTLQKWTSPLLQNHPLVGQVFSTKDGRELSTEELLEALKQYKTILVGEKHDNADHHQLEQWLVTHLLIPNQSTLVLEMLDDNLISENFDAGMSDQQIQQALNWSDNSWPWLDYGPVIQTAISKEWRLRGGNITRDQIMDIYQNGIPQTPRFISTQAIPETLKTTLLEHVFESHCEMMPRESLSPMVDVQIARDASMANAIMNTQSQRVLLLAGGFHVQKSVGVPLHLTYLTQETASSSPKTWVTLQLAEVQVNKNALSEYEISKDADFVWFTPKQTDKDYCEDLRKSKPHKSESVTD